MFTAQIFAIEAHEYQQMFRCKYLVGVHTKFWHKYHIYKKASKRGFRLSGRAFSSCKSSDHFPVEGNLDVMRWVVVVKICNGKGSEIAKQQYQRYMTMIMLLTMIMMMIMMMRSTWSRGKPGSNDKHIRTELGSEPDSA